MSNILPLLRIVIYKSATLALVWVFVITISSLYSLFKYNEINIPGLIIEPGTVVLIAFLFSMTSMGDAYVGSSSVTRSPCVILLTSSLILLSYTAIIFVLFDIRTMIYIFGLNLLDNLIFILIMFLIFQALFSLALMVQGNRD